MSVLEQSMISEVESVRSSVSRRSARSSQSLAELFERNLSSAGMNLTETSEKSKKRRQTKKLDETILNKQSQLLSKVEK